MEHESFLVFVSSNSWLLFLQREGDGRTMAAKNGGSDGPVSKYETEEGLKEVAAFLRGRNGMPLRPAIEVDKRVEYFKGESSRKERGGVFAHKNNTVRRPMMLLDQKRARTHHARDIGMASIGVRLDAGKVQRVSCVMTICAALRGQLELCITTVKTLLEQNGREMANLRCAVLCP